MQPQRVPVCTESLLIQLESSITEEINVGGNKGQTQRSKTGVEVGDICLLRLVWLHRALEGLSYIMTFIISAMYEDEKSITISIILLCSTLRYVILSIAEKAYK